MTWEYEGLVSFFIGDVEGGIYVDGQLKNRWFRLSGEGFSWCRGQLSEFEMPIRFM